MLDRELGRGSPTTSNYNNNNGDEYMAVSAHSDDGDDGTATSDIDSLADADDSEVEKRVLENLGWDTVGSDRELQVVDMERWKLISELHTTEGTDEYGEFLRVLEWSESMSRCRTRLG